MARNRYIHALNEVILYLEGKIDLYDGHHNSSIEIWNEAWDEMVFTGYTPDNPKSIDKYMAEQLG